MRQYQNFEFEEYLIEAKPAQDLGILVVIPANDEPEIVRTIDSIYDAEPVEGVSVELIVVFNDSSEAPTRVIWQNRQSFEKLQQLSDSYRNNCFIRLLPLHINNLPPRYAGVGLARKIGMDEAVKRLELIGRLKEGIVCSLDADVEIGKKYFRQIWNTFSKDKYLRAANIRFEHKLGDVSPEAENAIVQYESHLRYHIQMQRIIGMPFAFHTIGSAMVVRASAYLAHFGMNKRQAGEDFYFLHKFIKTGQFREINNTVVYPSARFSDRVPFGTGRMIGKIMDKDKLLTTYHYESYCALQKLRSNLEDLHQNPGMDYGALPIHYVDFIGQKGCDEIEKIRTHTSDLLSFKKRFFQWFDAFQFIKYLHFMRDRVYPDITVDEAVSKLFELLSMDQPKDLRHSLIELRKLQKGSAYLPYHFSNK